MSKRLKIEIASNTSQYFYHTILSGHNKKVVLIISCSVREGKKNTNTCHLSSFYVCLLFWTISRPLNDDVECLLVRWNLPPGPCLAQCFYRKWMHCTEAVCHPIVSQAQASVGLFVLQHTQQPLCPCNILHAAVNTGAQASLSAAASLRKGSWATYQVRALLCFGNVLNSSTFLLPLGQEKQANGDPLCWAYLWGVWVSDFQSPHGIFIHNSLTQTKKQWSPLQEMAFP